MKNIALAGLFACLVYSSIDAMNAVKFVNHSKFVAILTNQNDKNPLFFGEKILNPEDTLYIRTPAQSGTISLEILNTDHINEQMKRKSWYGSTMVDSYDIEPGEYTIEGIELHKTTLVIPKATRQTDKN
jgi:hypothetical protein